MYQYLLGMLLLPLLLACSVELEPDTAALTSADSHAVLSSSSATKLPLPVSSQQQSASSSSSVVRENVTADAVLNDYFVRQISDQQVLLHTKVTRVLADDNEGSRHQRFIVGLRSGQTLLIAHNIDLAPRVPLSLNDSVQIYGEYEWNSQGGVVHWTHKDPAGRHVHGWIRHNGALYQ